MVSVRFLGTPVIAFDDNPVVEFTQAPVVLRLLTFLVMHRQQPQQRSFVAGTFWPDVAEERARRNLTTVFWRLRSILPNADHFFAADKQTLHFNLHDDDWLDVVEFDQATQRCARLATMTPQAEQTLSTGLTLFEDTLALYRGDFLTGIEDEWCLLHRTHWHERYMNTLENFVAYCQAGGELVRALPKAQQLVVLEPYRERGHQRLIELSMALGRPAEARVHFEQYEHLWRTELGLPVSAHMVQLAQRFGFRAAPPAAIPRAVAFDADQPTPLQEHPEYLRRQLEICYQNDELYDLMADRQRQGENLLVGQALADKLQAPTIQIEMLARRTWLTIHQGNYVQALDLAHSGLQLCEESKQAGQRAWLHRLIGVTSEEMGNFSAALHHYTKALQLDEAQQVGDFMPANLNNVAATQLTLGQYCLAIQLLERAQTLFAVNSASRIVAVVIGNLGYAWLKIGMLDRADRHLQQALTMTQRLGNRNTEWWLAAVIARMYHLRGETTRAITFALHHYNAARPTGDAWVLTYLADTLALLYADQQDGEASLQWAQWMQAHAVQKEQRRYQVRSLLRLAQANLLLGQTTHAFDLMGQAIEHYVAQHQPVDEEPELFATYAHCAASMGDPLLAAEAQQKAQQALHTQLAAIADPALRQHFLCVQRHPYLPCHDGTRPASDKVGTSPTLSLVT